MKLTKILFLIFISTALTISISCKPKAMTLSDFAKIDIEITSTDMKPESIEKIAKKYGYTLKTYNEFQSKVENDSKLKEKLGEARLKELQKDQKKK